MKMALNFYTDLFCADPDVGGQFIQGRFPSIDDTATHRLQTECTMEETVRALKGMGALKAPGPDGFQPIFFKKTWEVTGSAVFDFVKRVMSGGSIPSEAAEALVVLVPKTATPETIKSFRPISLCNVSLKIATKLIVNRLKDILKSIIGPN